MFSKQNYFDEFIIFIIFQLSVPSCLRLQGPPHFQPSRYCFCIIVARLDGSACKVISVILSVNQFWCGGGVESTEFFLFFFLLKTSLLNHNLRPACDFNFGYILPCKKISCVNLFFNGSFEDMGIFHVFQLSFDRRGGGYIYP